MTMKKLSLLSIVIAGLFIFASCDKGEMGPTANMTNAVPPSINAPESGSSYQLSQSAEEEVALTMEWSEPGFNFRSAPTYSIQMVESDSENDFSEIATTQQTSYEFVTADLNNAMISAGLAPNNSHDVDFRVVASLADESVEAATSTAVNLSVTPYFAEVSYPEIYVPGGYQSASNEGSDWTPGDAPALYSVNEDDNYEGYVYIANDNSEFKFTDERNWDLNWGDDGADGTLDENSPNNIVASTAGYYKMNVNLNDLTYTTLNTTWGLIGSATADGWNSDQDMTYDPQNKVWTITADLAAGEIKFRANDAWNLDYGDTGADGRLDQGGDNIAVDEAGNYTVTLDLSEAPYTYSLTMN